MAERWTKAATPSSAAIRAMRVAPSFWTAWKLFLPPLSKVPTQFTTASAPCITARTLASSRMLQKTGSTCPTTP